MFVYHFARRVYDSFFWEDTTDLPELLHDEVPQNFPLNPQIVETVTLRGIEALKYRAKNGDSEACHRLYLCYLHGRKGTQQDEKLAAVWFQKWQTLTQKTAPPKPDLKEASLEQLAELGRNGHGEACIVLYHFYHRRSINDSIALDWLDAACRLNNPEALYKKGILLCTGQKYKYNRPLGESLMALAIQLGYSP